jgi:hypothetical protein
VGDQVRARSLLFECKVCVLPGGIDWPGAEAKNYSTRRDFLLHVGTVINAIAAFMIGSSDL